MIHYLKRKTSKERKMKQLNTFFHSGQNICIDTLMAFETCVNLFKPHNRKSEGTAAKKAGALIRCRCASFFVGPLFVVPFLKRRTKIVSGTNLADLPETFVAEMETRYFLRLKIKRSIDGLLRVI